MLYIFIVIGDKKWMDILKSNQWIINIYSYLPTYTFVCELMLKSIECKIVSLVYSSIKLEQIKNLKETGPKLGKKCIW